MAPPAPDEAALVLAAQAGDRAAFGAIYQRYRPMVYSIVFAHVGPGAADDVAQDVFLKAMNRIESLREATLLGPWLTAIARRAATDYHRRRPVESLNDFDAPSEGTGEPTDAARTALQALLSLPEAYRETLTMRFVEGMTGPEIAARTGMKHESVRVNLCRGMKMLRTALQEKPVRKRQ